MARSRREIKKDVCPHIGAASSRRVQGLSRPEDLEVARVESVAAIVGVYASSRLNHEAAIHFDTAVFRARAENALAECDAAPARWPSLTGAACTVGRVMYARSASTTEPTC